jgi:hypothetical protein
MYKTRGKLFPNFKYLLIFLGVYDKMSGAGGRQTHYDSVSYYITCLCLCQPFSCVFGAIFAMQLGMPIRFENRHLFLFGPKPRTPANGRSGRKFAACIHRRPCPPLFASWPGMQIRSPLLRRRKMPIPQENWHFFHLYSPATQPAPNRRPIISQMRRRRGRFGRRRFWPPPRTGSASTAPARPRPPPRR